MHRDTEQTIDRILNFIGTWLVRLVWIGIWSAIGLMIWTGIKYEMAN